MFSECLNSLCSQGRICERYKLPQDSTETLCPTKGQITGPFSTPVWPKGGSGLFPKSVLLQSQQLQQQGMAMSPLWPPWGLILQSRRVSPPTLAAHVRNTHLYNVKPLLPVSLTFSPSLIRLSVRSESPQGADEAFQRLCVCHSAHSGSHQSCPKTLLEHPQLYPQLENGVRTSSLCNVMSNI